MRNWFQQLYQNEEGATAVEYGIIAALIAITILVGAASTGSSLSGLFSMLSGSISQAQSSCS